MRNHLIMEYLINSSILIKYHSSYYLKYNNINSLGRVEIKKSASNMGQM